MKEEETSTGCLLAVVLVLLIPFSWTWRGFVLAKLWGWFVVPLGLEPIGIAHAIGLWGSVAMLAQTRWKDDSDKDLPVSEKCLTAILAAAIMPAVAWLIGAVVHSFM